MLSTSWSKFSTIYDYGLVMKSAPYLCLCAVFLSFFACSKPKPVEARKEASGPVPVRVATVRPKHVQRAVESIGTLYPFDEVLISAEIEGKIDQVNVDLGDAVTQGQVLVHIGDEEQRYLLAQ